MFLITKLESVATRFPKDVDGAREFLLDRGIPATSPDALKHFSARLAIDPSFRRDVTSILHAIIRREKEAVDYMDLLAILVVAATGEGQRTVDDAQEEAVREILRFLTHVRRPAALDAVERIETVLVIPQHVKPFVTSASPAVETRLPVLSRESSQQDAGPFASRARFSAAEASDPPWWQARVAWVVGVAALIFGLGSGWLLHREKAPAEHAAMSPKSVAPTGLPEDKESPTIESSSIGRLRKSEPVVTRDASPAAPRLNHRVFSQAAPVAEPMAPIRPLRSSDAVPKSPPEASLRPPAPAAVATASPHSYPLTSSPENSLNNSAPINTAPAVTPGVRRRLPKVVILRPGEPRRVTSPFGSLSPPAPGVVHPGSAGMMAANLISSPTPAYPAEAFQARVQGEVTVRAVVDREGNITDARVVSGPELLRSAALEAVQHWHYKPYRQGGKPIEVATTAIVDFELP